MRRESKFYFSVFHGYDDSYFVVSSERYTLEEAIDIFKEEMNSEEVPPIKLGTVFFGFGVDDGGERQNAWWLNVYDSKSRNHTPVYVFEM